MHKKDMAAKIIKEMHNIVGQQNCVFIVFEKCTIIIVRNTVLDLKFYLINILIIILVANRSFHNIFHSSKPLLTHVFFFTRMNIQVWYSPKLNTQKQCLGSMIKLFILRSRLQCFCSRF